MFHVQNGLFFKRQENGDVQIIQTSDGLQIKADRSNVLFDQTMPVDSFASVVASMSRGGEGDGRFYKAREFLTE